MRHIFSSKDAYILVYNSKDAYIVVYSSKYAYLVVYSSAGALVPLRTGHLEALPRLRTGTNAPRGTNAFLKRH